MNKTKILLTTLLSTGLLFSSLPSMLAAPVTSYSGPFSSSSQDSTPVLKPLWTAKAEIASANNSYAIHAQTANGILFYPNQNKLLAVNPTSGRSIWSIPAKLNSELAIADGALYFVDQAGSLNKVDTKTGRTLWKNKTGLTNDYGMFTVVISEGKLYISSPQSLRAYDPKSGKQLWKRKSESDISGTIYGVHEGVLIASFVVSGAMTVDQYNGYDPKTGKKLWTLGGSYGPILDVRNGSLYLRDNSLWATQDHSAKLDKYSIKTGQLLSSASSFRRRHADCTE